MTTNPTDEVVAFPQVEEVWAYIDCYNRDCGYSGRMTGYINQLDPKDIKFICPECSALEIVKNPEVR